MLTSKAVQEHRPPKKHPKRWRPPHSLQELPAVNPRFSVALSLLLAGCLAVAAEPARGPTIRLERGVFEVVGLAPEVLTQLGKMPPEKEQWTALFAVYVDGTGGADRPAILGSYRVEDNLLRFEPRFPPAEGVRYRAVFQPSRLPGAAPNQEPVVAQFAIPKTAAVPTVVEHVYPSSSKLPENQLKF